MATLSSAPDDEAGWHDAFIDQFAWLIAVVVDRTAAQLRIPLSRAERDELLAEVIMEMMRDDAAVLQPFRRHASLPTFIVVVARRLVVRGLLRRGGAAENGR
jgi:RNA polymerase sigma-70 factor (ECF subfamily)